MSNARPCRRPRADTAARRSLARLARVATVAASLFAIPVALPAQQTDVVAGVVVDAATLTPLDGVQVGVEGTQLGGVTDAAGRFRITGVSGTQVTLQLRRLGFRPANEVVRVGTTNLRLTMSVSPAQLNEV